MSIDKITNAPTPNEHIAKTNEIIDVVNQGGGGGGTTTDVQINGTSITSNNVANIITNSTYDATTNKIATMSDVPDISGKANNNDVVHLEGAETITGEKKFRVTPYVWSSAQNAWDPIIGSVQISNYFANKTLSNLGATSSTNFDGQWFKKTQDLDTNSAIHSTSYNIGTSGYLPSDYTDYVYEVMGNIRGATSENTISYGAVGTAASPVDNDCYKAEIEGNANARRTNNFFILPITNGDIHVQIKSKAFGSGFRVSLYGYRRIGTNT